MRELKVPPKMSFTNCSGMASGSLRGGASCAPKITLWPEPGPQPLLEAAARVVILATASLLTTCAIARLRAAERAASETQEQLQHARLGAAERPGESVPGDISLDIKPLDVERRRGLLACRGAGGMHRGVGVASGQMEPGGKAGEAHVGLVDPPALAVLALSRQPVLDGTSKQRIRRTVRPGIGLHAVSTHSLRRV